jgi:hypothetical protein
MIDTTLATEFRAALVVADNPVMLEVLAAESGSITVQLPTLLITANTPAAVFIADAEGNVIFASELIILTQVAVD